MNEETHPQASSSSQTAQPDQDTQLAAPQKKLLPSEFIYQLVALVVAIIVVHAVYVAVIRPNADAILEQQQARVAAGEAYQPSRSLYVILQDYEQETCLILMFWAMAIMGIKARGVLRERALLDQGLVKTGIGSRILPEDARDYMRPVQRLPAEQQNFLIARVILTALQRFAATRNIQDVSTTVRVQCETESERLDSELSMIRYIAWAIPSIGFIGTVRGIGEALSQAHEAVQGNIAGVTASLGVAFNSTFTALVISIIVMFFMHQLQLQQERLVLDSQSYVDNQLLQYLKVKS